MNLFYQEFISNLPDDIIDGALVDVISKAATAKLAKKRIEGRGGWHSPECSAEHLFRMLVDHLPKGDMIDVINLAGMIHVRQHLFGEKLPAAVAATPASAMRLGQQFKAGSDGTVTDLVNGLQWQAQASPHRLAFKEAERYCKDLTLAGHADWRLPTEEELLSLVDRKRYKPAINPELFPGTESAFYWSSTPVAEIPGGFAWGVLFGYGYAYILRRGGYGFVRAVRSVAPAAPGQ